MIVFVANLSGKKFRLEVEHNDSVLTLKKLVRDLEQYELEEIGLVIGAQVLENDRSLSDYRLQNESLVTLVGDANSFV